MVKLFRVKGRPILIAGYYGFSPSWGMTLLTVAAIGLFATLGDWQLKRYEAKKQTLQQQQIARDQPAIEFTSLEETKLRTLIIAGYYQPEKQFLLDNQLYQQQVGYQVYTPFRLDNGLYLIINRGWVAAPPKRANLPLIGVDSKRHRLLVEARKRDKLLPLFGQAAETERWPIRIQRSDMVLMAKLAELNLASQLEMQLLPGQTGGLTMLSATPSLKPQRHLGYALQWFTFAILALGLWVGLNTHRKKVSGS